MYAQNCHFFVMGTQWLNMKARFIFGVVGMIFKVLAVSCFALIQVGVIDLRDLCPYDKNVCMLFCKWPYLPYF